MQEEKRRRDQAKRKEDGEKDKMGHAEGNKTQDGEGSGKQTDEETDAGLTKSQGHITDEGNISGSKSDEESKNNQINNARIGTENKSITAPLKETRPGKENVKDNHETQAVTGGGILTQDGNVKSEEEKISENEDVAQGQVRPRP